jgi:transcriptional regulator with XRE-family HTH domain
MALLGLTCDDPGSAKTGNADPFDNQLESEPDGEAGVRKRAVRRSAPEAATQSVDNLNVEESIKAKAIGERIRRLRLKRSMGLVELGQRTGMSASFLSQLETGRVVPTLRNLSRIALVFGKDLCHFMQDEKKNQFKKSRARDRVRLPIGDKAAPQFISESMSALIPDRTLVPCIAEFLPNTRNAVFEPTTFAGQEFVYVMHGSLTLSTQNEREELEDGDVVWIDGSTKRQYRCKDGKPAAAMIITFPLR